VVVNNHASGVTDGDWLLREVRATLPGATVRFTDSLDDLHDALGGRRRVVLVGGDGSLHAALNAPVGVLPELALVPAGSANNVARALGIPVELRAALRVAGAAAALPLDALRVETRDRTLLALEGVSAGLQADARARYRADNSDALLRGVAALVVALARFDPPEARVVVDGVERHAGPLAQLFLSNLPYFGPGFHVSPHADPRDGRFDVVGFDPAGRARMVRLLARVRRGAHLGERGVWTLTGSEATIEGEVPLVADSVPLGAGPAAVRVERGRLRLAAPGARP
jgi:diacylglycerol kinase (ATP)